ncbi:hypothetical protein [Vibrio ostreae]|uniref:Uncharacterized protein n=1 Tax=Vibrio ostreae TaxID=2841925 RepID=A0A975UCA4_9VIBR|nr:hypothetical protein [Vibrio ostreae]QXO19224.1 hypothetical protein KNV97_13645 [Vibrio ostreae]
MDPTNINTFFHELFSGTYISTLGALLPILSSIWGALIAMRSWYLRRQRTVLDSLEDALKGDNLDTKTKEFLESELAAKRFEKNGYGYAKRELREALIDRSNNYVYGIFTLGSSDLRGCCEVVYYCTEKDSLFLKPGCFIHFTVRIACVILAGVLLSTVWIITGGVLSHNVGFGDTLILLVIDAFTLSAATFYLCQSYPLISYIKMYAIIRKDKSKAEAYLYP